MLDFSTLSLLLVMVGFILVAVVVVHYQSNTEKVRRKRNEVAAHSQKLNQRLDVLEKEIVDLKVQVDGLDEEIDSIN